MIVDKHNQVAQMLFGIFICMSDSTHQIILKDTHHEITWVNTMLKEPFQRLDMSHWQEAVEGVVEIVVSNSIHTIIESNKSF
jgi:hypothetical protein